MVVKVKGELIYPHGSFHLICLQKLLLFAMHDIELCGLCILQRVSKIGRRLAKGQIQRAMDFKYL